METFDLARSKALNTIPQRKLHSILSLIQNSDSSIQEKNIKTTAINRYAESNIPIEYWSLRMERDFVGDKRLFDRYVSYTNDLKTSYLNGASICFAGAHGVGKSMTVCSILKQACKKGYSCLYTNLGDIVSVLTTASGEDKFISRRELNLVDFLVIDEFDPRFMPSENAADLYARSLEGVFRTRAQNKLPTIMATNSPNPIESFSGSLKASVSSLMKGYMETFVVLGKDFREVKRENQ